MFRRIFRSIGENPITRYSQLMPETDLNEYSARFKFYQIINTLPILAGGLCSLYFPYAQLYPEFIPNIGLGTVIYSTMHLTLLSAIHLGFGSIEQIKALPVMNTNIPQLVYPIIGPFVAGYSAYLYWNDPFTQYNSLLSVSLLSSLYLAINCGDYYFCRNKVDMPTWYFSLKLKITILAILGLGSLALAIKLYPDQLKIQSKGFPPTLEEILGK